MLHEHKIGDRYKATISFKVYSTNLNLHKT